MATLLQFLERILIVTNDRGEQKFKSDKEDRDVVTDPKTGEPREVWKHQRMKYGKGESQRKFKSLGVIRQAGHKGRVTRWVNKLMGRHIKTQGSNVQSRTSYARDIDKYNKDAYERAKKMNQKHYGVSE